MTARDVTGPPGRPAGSGTPVCTGPDFKKEKSAAKEKREIFRGGALFISLSLCFPLAYPNKDEDAKSLRCNNNLASSMLSTIACASFISSSRATNASLA